MIGFTKLLCGMATIGEALNYGRETDSATPAHMLQFTTADKPLVAWNTTRRCNLRCLHCYLDSEDKDYAGELTTEQACEVVDILIEKTYDWHKRGIETEILTTDNHADGVMVEKHIRKTNPERAQEITELQKLHGGCSAGHKFANEVEHPLIIITFEDCERRCFRKAYLLVRLYLELTSHKTKM